MSLIKFLLFGLLAMLVLLPAAGILMIVGLPVLVVLAVVGLPLLALLMIVGLPVFAVFVVIAVALGLIFGLLGLVVGLGIAALKIASSRRSTHRVAGEPRQGASRRSGRRSRPLSGDGGESSTARFPGGASRSPSSAVGLRP
jgi:hypothetical protein